MTRKTLALGASLATLLSGAAIAADAELVVFDWPGFEEDAYWAKYAEIHGESPTYTFFGEEDEAFQKLRSGFKADVSHPCSQSVDKWRQAGLIEPWDITKIPNYASVAEQYKTAEIFTDDGDVYFIPADNGATAIAWNTEKLSEADVQSLQMFVDPKYAGRISLPDNVDDVYSLAYLATGTTDWTSATEDDFKKASEWLRKAHANVRAYWADGAELQQLMATGEVLAAWSWNEIPVQMAAEGLPIAFEREPVEGSSVWFCGYVNMVDGPGSEDKAHEFMNAWLDPSVTEYIVTEWGYGHSNTGAMAAIGLETLEEVGLAPVDVPLLAQLPMDNRLREAMVAEFEKIKIGF